MPDTNCWTLITGASSGIGRAVAERLSHDRRLILHGRDVPRLEASRAACAHPEQHLLWPFDLKAVEPISASLAAFMNENKITVDCFIHCAGTVGALPMRGMDYAAIQEIMGVNFTSAAQIITVLLKKMINQQKLKNIVFISSIWSRFGSRGHGLYCASKGALDSLMRALAVELSPSVRVNSVLPGAVPSRMASSGMADPDIAAKLQQDYPLGVGEPDDIARTVAFLVSDQARWITGQQIVVDGGRTANMSLK